MAEAAATGLRRLDLGKGDEEYKTVLANRELLVTDFILGRPALRSTARQLVRRVGQLRSAG
jgi:CelD/BcsL family acetyltransferase involved in cellulose biosynthesis